MVLLSLRRLLAACLVVLPLVPCAGAGAAANPAGFVIHRGTNLSHWLSQDFKWVSRAIWITENDIRFIARLGFDHVRLPVDEKELWGKDGGLVPAEVDRLLQAIGWCRAAGLRVIVDLHTIDAHHFNAAFEGGHNTLWKDPGAQERFLDLWRGLSLRLRHLPVDAVAYEILNEPVADDHTDWNKLVARAVEVIRRSEPDRVLVIGANRWQMPMNLPHLAVPEGDRNIILSFHTYAPMLFTHFGADWTPLKTFAGPVNYPGPVVDRSTHDRLMKNPERSFTDLVGNAADEWNAARLREEMAPAIRRARELGLQLYCGEFGCLPTVPRAARLAYYRDIVGVFEAEGIAWCNWEYKGDFGLLEWHGRERLWGAPDNGLIDALMQR